MTAPSITLGGGEVLRLDMHLPMNGAWAAEVQVASDSELSEGDNIDLLVNGSDPFSCRVVRAGVEAERLHVRLTGGSVNWQLAVTVKHYRNTTVNRVLEDVGVTLDQSNDTELEYWTRNPGTVGSTVKTLADHLGFDWRVNPDGTVRMREEAASSVDAEAVEVHRNPGRGLVVVAPQNANILPGTQHGDDLVGEVIYQLSDTFRCRYYTSSRGVLRGQLEKLIRWVTRDTIYLGMYTCEVVSQSSDGSLDLLPDDDRLRAEGLQAVPIRHGLPGVTVVVPAGERVLLGFDNGDPNRPYAALWHEGQVTSVNIGGSVAVALSDLVDDRIETARTTWIVPTSLGPSGTPEQGGAVPLETTASEVLHTR